MRNASNSAAILQASAVREWFSEQGVTTRWPGETREEMSSSARSVKKYV